MGRVYKSVCACVLVLAVGGCTSSNGKSSGKSSNKTTQSNSQASIPADNPLNLPKVISAREPACQFESLIGVQYLIEAKGSQDAAATLGATLQSAQKDGGVGVLGVIQQGYSAEAKATALGNEDDLLGVVTQAVKSGCTAGKNPTLTQAQWLALAQLVGAEASVVSRVKLFRPAGTPG